MTQIEQGRGEQLEAVLEQAGEIVAGLRMGHYHHTLAYSHAALATLRGHFAEAEWLIEQAAEIGHGRGVADYITEALRVAQLTGLRHEQGRLAEIRQRAVGLYADADQRLWLGMVALIEAETGHASAAHPPPARVPARLPQSRPDPTRACRARRLHLLRHPPHRETAPPRRSSTSSSPPTPAAAPTLPTSPDPSTSTSPTSPTPSATPTTPTATSPTPSTSAKRSARPTGPSAAKN